MMTLRVWPVGSGAHTGLPAVCLAALLAAWIANPRSAMSAEAAQQAAPVSPMTSPVAPAVSSAQWKVIVHPANKLRTMSREELERIYRKRIPFWSDHNAILPVNLPGSDPLRRAFSTEILRSDEDELVTYWNRQYFQGVAPPVVLQSSGAVRAYVAATPGAIGYVSLDSVDSSVAVVEVTNGR